MHQIRKTNYTVVIISLFFAYSEGGTCQNRLRAYKTICENCKASRYCTAVVGSEPPVSPGICNDTCQSHGSCQMVQHNSEDDICDMYDCTEVDMETGYSMKRLSCRSDCFLSEISFFAGYIGICPTLRTYGGQPSVERCLSLCLDLNGCKGSTFWTNGSCHLHHCTNIETSNITGVSFYGYSCLDVPTTTISSIPSSSNELQVSTTYSSELQLVETSSISLSQIAVSTFASSQLPEATNLPSSSRPAESSSMHTTTQLSQAQSTNVSTTPYQVSSLLMSFPPSQERPTLSLPLPSPTKTVKVSSSQLNRTPFTHSLMQNLSDAPVTHSETQTSLSQPFGVPSLLSSTQPPVHQSTQPPDMASYTTSIRNEITVQATAFWTKTTSPTTTLAYAAIPTIQTDTNIEEGIFDNPTNVAAAASVGGVAAGLAVGVGVQALKAKQCDKNANTVV